MQNESETPDDPPIYPMVENNNANGFTGEYQKTNEPVFNLPAIVLLFVALCFGIHFVREYLISTNSDSWIIWTFAYFPIRFTPEYFTVDLATIASPLSYSLLHGSWSHLALNMIWLVIFGTPVAYRLGWKRSILFWVVTALGSVLMHTLIYFGDEIPLIGASGAVSGFLGGAARFGFRSDKANPRAGLKGPLYGPIESLKMRGVLPFLLIWVIMNVAFGTNFFSLAGSVSIAWEAHIGGLLTGYFGIALLDIKVNT